MSRQQVPNIEILNGGVSLISAPDRVAGPLSFKTGGTERMLLDGNLYLNNWLMLTHVPSNSVLPFAGATGDDRAAIYGGPLGIRFHPNGQTGGPQINFTSTGDLALTSGKRISSPSLSSAQASARLAFQGSTMTILNIMPAGSDRTAVINFHDRSDADNSGYMTIGTNGTAVVVESGATGSGATLPMRFGVGGLSRLSIETDGDVALNTASNMLKRWGTNTGLKPMNPATLGPGNATALFTANEQGYVFINVPGIAASAMYYIRGGAAQALMIYNAVGGAGYQFSNVKNTADSSNFYWESGGYWLQNKNASAYGYTILFLRLE